MLVPRALRSFGLVSVVLGAASAQMACSSSSTTGNEGFTGSGAESAGTSTASANGGGSASTFVGTGTSSGPGAGPGAGGGSQGPLDVTPSALQTITVQAGSTTPTVHYTATVNGNPVNAGWTVDQGNIGTIPQGPSSGADFAPTGTTGGIVDVIAGYSGNNVSRQVLVKLTAKQNGGDPNNPAEAQQIATDTMDTAQLMAGGGIGGVGGEGLGGAVTDPAVLAALNSPMAEPTLTFLYPYDKTVFPRGLLAPLVQWSWATNDADAIKMELVTTSGSFSWSGTFGRPPNLPTGTFIRMPVPQDVWDMATNSAGGLTPSGGPDQLTLKLTVAKGSTGYGPISETWTVAPGRLAGTVYYNSYGTNLVKNSNRNDVHNAQFGAAVLSIAQGATGPSVVAGTNGDSSGSACRVCHVVSADGSKLIAEHGNNYAQTSSYDLKNGNAETYLAGNDGVFPWAGLYPDGSLALTNQADLGVTGTASAQLYNFPPTGAGPIAATGIEAAAVGTPGFSPDGKHVAFDFLGGSIGASTGDGTQLAALDFDVASLSFSNLRVLATMSGGQRAGFPSFFPTNDAVAFHYQLVNANHTFNTWQGAQAQIWWSDLASGTAAPLLALNGLEADGATPYLPSGPNNHANDTTLNYEPTVNPVVSGGYAWVVFTSRRLYGSVATIEPWTSDPGVYDNTVYANITCKKLWVAAVDIGSVQNGTLVPPTPGSDPSHPAFYLPAQELVAGNARGFWVLDPCKADGMSCETGDQCCNGYCEPNGQGGALVCSNTPPNGNCSGTQEKCTVSADCCDPAEACINGFCSQSIPH
ncbi:MAG TPA: hypothetical protein VH560_13015 [Polyangia bacterium]|jgi:hypothetical protein|nr:hypothetical protein [Polyangia bacterium]